MNDDSKAKHAARTAGVDAFNHSLQSVGRATGVDAFGVAIDAYIAARRAEGFVEVPRKVVEPFAKVASREDAHGSTIGHKDMPDTQPVKLVMPMGRQEYIDMSLTLGDFRAMLKATETPPPPTT